MSLKDVNIFCLDTNGMFIHKTWILSQLEHSLSSYFGRCGICNVQLEYISRRFFWIMINFVPNVITSIVTKMCAYLLCNKCRTPILLRKVIELIRKFDRNCWTFCMNYSIASSSAARVTLRCLMWTVKHYILEKFKTRFSMVSTRISEDWTC